MLIYFSIFCKQNDIMNVQRKAMLIISIFCCKAVLNLSAVRIFSSGSLIWVFLPTLLVLPDRIFLYVLWKKAQLAKNSEITIR